MKKIICILLFFALSFPFFQVSAESSGEMITKKYPNRKFFPGLSYLSTDEMVAGVAAGKFLVIDARPALGYNTLHIIDAVNIHTADKQFLEKVMEVIKKNNKPIVFYCGGLTCLKSYKGSMLTKKELRKRKIKREVYTYDSGITAFAYASPERVLKNGKPISPENPILDVKKLKQHSKSAKDFIALINNDEEGRYTILDVREKQQRILRKLFMFKKEHKITILESDKLIEFLHETKRSGKTLMVYAGVEKQIESVFALIQITGVKDWFYLEGGEYAYSKYMIDKNVYDK